MTLPSPEYVRPASQLRLWVVRAWEPEPPPGSEAVDWVLLTSWSVDNALAARQVTRWYECRWLVEDFHQCLKTGCRLEQSQLDHQADLERLLRFVAPLAIRLLQLRQAARYHSNQPAQQVFDPVWVQLLAAYFHRDPRHPDHPGLLSGYGPAGWPFGPHPGWPTRLAHPVERLAPLDRLGRWGPFGPLIDVGKEQR